MRKLDAQFMLAGSIMTILFLIVVSIITGTNYPWVIHPAFLIMISLINTALGNRKRYKAQAIFVSVLIILYLLVINVLHTPDYPWVLYVIYPLLWWPILISLGSKAKSFRIAVLGSGSLILYYVLLNLYLSPTYLWFFYPAFVFLWWPISIHYSQKLDHFLFSVQGSLLIIVFFITVNGYVSPQTIWAVYPIFVVLWWPLSLYFYGRK